MTGRTLLPVVCVALLAACVATPEPLPKPELREAGLPGLEDCRGSFEATDARVAAAGAGHHGYQRIPGFPYLRTDRTLASFAEEVQSAEAVGTWVRRMRAHDAEAREYELQNVGLQNPERHNLHTDLYRCGRGLAFIDLEVPGNLALLRAQAARIAAGPPPERGLERLGEMLAAPVRAIRESSRRASVREVFDMPPPEHSAEVVWEGEATRQRGLVPLRLDELRRDALGYPGMIGSAWRALAEKHAPQLWLDGVAAGTSPAALYWDEQQRLRARTETPTVYYRIDFRRDGSRMLPEIDYVVFLPAESSETPRALRWTVTLGPDVEPLLYESPHPAGSPHRVFPAAAGAERLLSGLPSSLILRPKVADGERALIRIAGEDPPDIVSVLNRQAANPAKLRQYRLAPYEQLFTLPLPQGGTRSAFGLHDALPVALLRAP